MKVPRPYQQVAINLGRRKNVLIADDRGLGKTLMAVEIGSVIADADGLPNLIVCNKAAKPQWRDEILDQRPNDKVILFSEPIQGKRYQESDLWVIAHFWQIANFGYAFRRTLWGMVCIDEAHKMKSIDVKLSKSLKKIECIRRVAMTGTPIEHGPRDFFSVLQWLYPQYYPRIRDFVQQHCELIAEWTPNGMKQKAGKCVNPGALAAELAPFTVHRTKADVAPDLPPKRVYRIPVAMERDQAAFYKAIGDADDIEVEFRGQNIIILNEMSRLTMQHQIASIPEICGYGISMPSAKLIWIEEYLLDNPNSRCIILSRYRRVAELISKKFHTALVVGRKISGLEEFKDGKIKHLSGSIGAMAESLSLPMADCIICIDMDWNAILMDQAQDRHHRINSTSTKDVIMLYTPGTVDDLVYDCVKGKWDETELVYQYIKSRKSPI